MKHSNRSFISSCLLAALMTLGTAAAETVNLHWDDCNTWTENKQFTGPGIYRQVVGGWGFDAPMRGYSIRIRITSSNVYNIPYEPPADAWRFDPAGCNAGKASASTSAQTCPTLGSGTAVSVAYDGSAVYVTLSATHDVVDPNPNTTYVLGQITYDHATSAIGPQNPAVACGHAERPACFVIDRAVWFDALNVSHPIGFERFTGVSWQDPGSARCLGDVPVQAVPWTMIKRLYD